MKGKQNEQRIFYVLLKIPSSWTVPPSFTTFYMLLVFFHLLPQMSKAVIWHCCFSEYLRSLDQEMKVTDRKCLPYAGIEGVVYLLSEKTLASERITIINASYYLVVNQCFTRIFSVVGVLSKLVWTGKIFFVGICTLLVCQSFWLSSCLTLERKKNWIGCLCLSSASGESLGSSVACFCPNQIRRVRERKPGAAVLARCLTFIWWILGEMNPHTYCPSKTTFQEQNQN